MSYVKTELESYKEYLKTVSLLSRLFSESDTPYIHYRTTEYLYCRLFGARNLSRSDVTVDAQRNEVGIGIKTFTYTGKRTQEKIAEFNGAIDLFKNLNGINKVREISRLRNERIELVEREFGVKSTIYHCVGRRGGELLVFEVPMNKINIRNIQLTKKSKSTNVISFSDENEQYSFNVSKSTLYKYFEATPENTLFILKVNLLDDPFESIKQLVSKDVKHEEIEFEKRVVLPLYSVKDGKPNVYEKSGLNRWKASGKKRKRRYGEAEIVILKDYRDLVHSILPPRDTPFEAIRPNGKKITLKVSQQDGKALMSNPETELGIWLLHDVMGLDENEALTYKRLVELGIDSVELIFVDGVWHINFCELGTFEKYLAENR